MELDDILVEIVNKIDVKRKKVESEAKKSPQYKSTGKYKKIDSVYLNELLTKRNTLVQVVNYIRTKEKKYLKVLEDE